MEDIGVVDAKVESCVRDAKHWRLLIILIPSKLRLTTSLCPLILPVGPLIWLRSFKILFLDCIRLQKSKKLVLLSALVESSIPALMFVA